MIRFYDNQKQPHLAQGTITRSIGINGGKSISGEIIYGDQVLSNLDYGWSFIFDNEPYVVTYKKLNDKTRTLEFDAVQKFFWDFSKTAFYDEWNGSHPFVSYVDALFAGSGYTYVNTVTVDAFEKENWGMKTKIDLFNDVISQAGVEFEVKDTVVYIREQVGNDLTSIVRTGINLSDMTEEIKMSDFATYGKGFGAFVDSEDHSKGRLEVEYRSPLAAKYGDLSIAPITDERYTINANLLQAVKDKVDATYSVSLAMTIYDLKSAGYAVDSAPAVGDWLTAIDEPLNFQRRIRIIKLDETFDATGKRIDYKATCGDLTVAEQYTSSQESTASAIQKIQSSVNFVVQQFGDGKYISYGNNEPSNPKNGDIWFDFNGDGSKTAIMQYQDGRWVKVVDYATGDEIAKAVDEAMAGVPELEKKINEAVDKASDAADKVSELDNVAKKATSDAAQAGVQAAQAGEDAKTAITNAAEAVNNAKSAQSTASQVSIKVDNAIGMISNKVDSTTVDELRKQVDTNTTSTTQTAKELASKANQTTVNELQKLVNTQGTNIFQNAQQLSLKADETIVSGLSDKLDKWSVGSRNYILKSDSFLTTVPTNIGTSVNTQDFKTSETGDFFFEKSLVVSVQVDITNVKSVGNNARAGFEMVMPTTGSKAYVGTWRKITKDDIGKDIHERIYTVYDPNDYTAFESLKTYAQRFTADSVSVGKPQLEIATVPSDWHAAPEDDGDAINALAQTVTTNKASQDITAKKVESKAEQSTVNTLNGDVTNLKGSMSAIAGQVDLMATKTDLQKATTGLVTSTYLSDQLRIQSDQFSNTITSITKQVNALGQTNVVNNSEWDPDFTGWTFTSGQGSYQRRVDATRNGSRVVNLTSNAKVSGGKDEKLGGFVGEWIPVSPGMVFSAAIEAVRWWIPDDGTGVSGRVQIQYAEAESEYYDPTGAKYSDNMVNFDPNTPAGWHRYTMENVTVPAGMKFMRWYGWIHGQHSDLNIAQPMIVFDSKVGAYVAGNFNNALIVSDLTQKLGSMQLTLQDAATKTQLTATTNQLTTMITDVSGKNMFSNSRFVQNGLGWSGDTGVPVTVRADLQMDENFVLNAGVDGVTGKKNNVTGHIYSSWISVKGGMVYSTSVYGIQYWYPNDGSTIDNYVQIEYKDSAGKSTWSSHFLTFKKEQVGYWIFGKLENVTIPDNVKQMRFIGNVVGSHSDINITEPMLVFKKTVPPYQPSELTADYTNSRFTQLIDQIDLRVMKNGVINAINVSAEGVTIMGSKLHITATTTIDNAIITNAMLKNVSADKVNTGTLNAAQVNVININGANIISKSITSDQFATNAILVGLNNAFGNSLQIFPTGITFYEASKPVAWINKYGMHVGAVTGESTGVITSQSLIVNNVSHPEYNGLVFGLDQSGDFMAWGYHEPGMGENLYNSKLAWYGTNAANAINRPKGFVVGDNITFAGTVYGMNSSNSGSPHVKFTSAINVTGHGAGFAIVNDNGAGFFIGNDGYIGVSGGGNMYDLMQVLQNVKW